MHELIRLAHIYAGANDGTKLIDFNLTVFSEEIVSLIAIHNSEIKIIKDVLNGYIQIKNGSFFLNENKMEHFNSNISHQKGIICLDSQNSLVDDLTISENIFAIRRHQKIFSPLVYNIKKNENKTEALLKIVDLNCSPATKVYELSMFKKYLVCILKAIAYDAKLIVFDCVLNSFSFVEYFELKKICKDLLSKGIAIIIMDEKINDLMEISNRIVFIKEGTNIKTMFSEDIKKTNIISHLIGKNTNIDNQLPKYDSKKIMLKINNKEGKNIVLIKQGQVLGFYDVEWETQCNFLDLLNDFMLKNSLDFFCNGINVLFLSEESLLKQKIIYISENSLFCLAENMRIGDNIALPMLKQLSNNLGMVSDAVIMYLEQEFKKLLNLNNDIKSITDLDRTSQKILSIYKWTFANPHLIILESPMQYIDINGQEQFKKFLNYMTSYGITIVMSSKDLSELRDLCNQIICINKASLKIIVSQDMFDTIDINEL